MKYHIGYFVVGIITILISPFLLLCLCCYTIYILGEGACQTIMDYLDERRVGRV